MKRLKYIVLSLILAGCSNSENPAQTNSPVHTKEIADWPTYGNDPGGTRFSPLTEINRSNVKNLELAWIYRTGESPYGVAGGTLSECTPIVVDGTMYVCTPLNKVIALNPRTGKEIWRYDPEVPNHHYANGPTCRGVSAWKDPKKKNDDPFSRLIFIGTNDGRLICLDAKSGRLNPNFGKNGQVDLKDGITEQGLGNYQVTSPPAIIRDLIIVGSSINDNWHQNEASGVVRAYDINTGILKWSWDPIPKNQNDPAFQTWGDDSAKTTGGANVWSIMSVDIERDLIFLPTTSASVDYFGGERPGKNLYANSIVALRASTGQYVWSFQVVHHDIWDYDIPCQPTLFDYKNGSHSEPALVQGTKMGNIFVLNRETGKPIFPIEERPVPQQAVDGEKPWPTQPFPITFAPVVPQKLNATDLWGLEELDQKWAQEKYKTLHYEGIFTPGSEKGSLVFPGNIGGVAWGGVAVDPQNQIMVVNTNRLAAIIKLIPREIAEKDAANKKADNKATEEKVVARELQKVEVAAMIGTPYVLERSYFVNPNGVPCNSPPWGALAAYDLKNGKRLWEVPLGVLHELKNHPDAKKWGSPNYGGPLVTAGGLVFIAATMDDHLRVFDRDTGDLLLEIPLPAGAQATPMTFKLSEDDMQYVVINAGGHGRLRTTPGDYFLAYALKKNEDSSH